MLWNHSFETIYKLSPDKIYIRYDIPLSNPLSRVFFHEWRPSIRSHYLSMPRTLTSRYWRFKHLIVLLRLRGVISSVVSMQWISHEETDYWKSSATVTIQRGLCLVFSINWNMSMPRRPLHRSNQVVYAKKGRYYRYYGKISLILLKFRVLHIFCWDIMSLKVEDWNWDQEREMSG